MKEKNLTSPNWATKFQKYFDHYSGRLNRLCGLSDKDVSVYILLITQKFFFKKEHFSNYEIVTKLNQIHNEYIPNELNSKPTTRSVKESLDRLITLGYVKKSKNKQKMKARGNPGKNLYSPCKISDLEQFTRNRLDDIRNQMMSTLQELYQVEEAINETKEND